MAPLWVVLLAGVAAWVAGGLWYGLLGEKWVAALGTTRAALMGPNGRPSPVPYLVAFLADVVMAWILALVMLGTASVGVAAALSWAAVLWLGFILAPMVTNYSFARRNPQLTLIDAGHWLCAVLAAAAVLGALG
jgi:FtsH-binding integral membrane protein